MPAPDRHPTPASAPHQINVLQKCIPAVGIAAVPEAEVSGAQAAPPAALRMRFDPSERLCIPKISKQKKMLNM
jgi:hypothetical protein